MANLKEIRTRIVSVSNTRQVTSAMKMVSAAKLRKSQEAVTKIRSYSNKMLEIVESVGKSVTESFDSPLFKLKPTGNTLVILVTSNKGLCGIFNAAITRMAVDWVKTERAEELENKQVTFFTIGKKGYDVVSRMGFDISGRDDNLVNKPSYNLTTLFTKTLLEKYNNGEYREIVVFYNSFKNVATQQQLMETFLPIKIKKSDDEKYDALEYILEPNADAILEELAPKMLETEMHKIVLDSIASEHGARMTAMHIATDNATELLDTLTLNYNKERQYSITNELLEIVSGANALKG
ncbi:MAG TPA: ATP synthase F1 subunit gamma [Salinivirgaceae bacterium]|nr:ATP synthase F1 subunit gamma [Salinivirgaceae bacterium]